MANILLIINDYQETMLIQHILELAGHQTQQLISGNITDRQLSAVDLVLLHLGRDVEHTLKILQTITATKLHNQLDLPVIVLSSLDMEDVRYQCEQLGATHYVIEPIKAAELRSLIEDSIS